MAEIGYSWCPVCKYWVPSKYLHIYMDESSPLPQRVCSNCQSTSSTELVFEYKSWNYDPYHESVRCPFCESYNTESCNSEQVADYWRCLDCGEKFVNIPY